MITHRPESRQHTEARMLAYGWHGNTIDGYTHAATGARIERVVTYRLVAAGASPEPWPTLAAAVAAWGRAGRGWQYLRLLNVRMNNARRKAGAAVPAPDALLDRGGAGVV